LAVYWHKLAFQVKDLARRRKAPQRRSGLAPRLARGAISGLSGTLCQGHNLALVRAQGALAM